MTVEQRNTLDMNLWKSGPHYVRSEPHFRTKKVSKAVKFGTYAV